MKNLLILLMGITLVASCKKDDDTKPASTSNNNNSGGTGLGHVTPEAVGKWLHGSFSMASFWGYDGSYHGTPYSSSVAFYFQQNGDYEMYYTAQTNDYGCTTDAFSYYKGYATFTDSTFTIHPLEGRFRGYYLCTPSYNFDRPASASELHEQTFYYTYETDANNQKWMVVRFDPTDQYPSYFKSTNW